MKLHEYCLLLAVFACAVPVAQAQLGPPMTATGRGPTRIYKDPTQDTGTILRKDLKWTSRIPLDKTYDQFTPAEKEELRDMYEHLPKYEEPPFPAEGMAPIFEALRKAQRILQAKGELNMVVTVGSDGQARKVEDLGGVHNIQMTEIAQQVLLLTTYKPGMCSGIPCTMVFPFKLKLKSG